MIKNISLPELHSSSNLVEKDSDDEHFISNDNQAWSIKKAFKQNKMFDMVQL